MPKFTKLQEWEMVGKENYKGYDDHTLVRFHDQLTNERRRFAGRNAKRYTKALSDIDKLIMDCQLVEMVNTFNNRRYYVSRLLNANRSVLSKRLVAQVERIIYAVKDTPSEENTKLLSYTKFRINLELKGLKCQNETIEL